SVAETFLLHQVLDHARQDIRQRSARLARADHVQIKRWEDARKIAQGLGETPSVNQRLMQRTRHLLNARMFQPLLKHAEALVESHAGLQEVAELLGENQQLAVRNLKVLCRSRARRHGLTIERRGLCRHRFDPNRDAILLLDLPDGNGAISDIEYAFDEA